MVPFLYLAVVVDFSGWLAFFQIRVSGYGCLSCD